MSTSSATRRRIKSVASYLRLLILDDEWSIRDMLSEFLAEHLPGAAISAVASAAEARNLLGESPYDIIFVDLGLPDANGHELVAELIESYPGMTVIVITGRPEIQALVTMFRKGIYDYLTKPINLIQLGVSVDRAVDHLNLARENELLRRDQAGRLSLPAMVGDSPQMSDLARQVRLIAGRDTSVLISGPSGTGKELVARAIHQLSPRAGGPFVPVNVAAIPETLIEAEFFGYGKNSGVSGAPPAGRSGMFEAASGGTLFLDEIGDMPLGAQAKVLRALQEREVVRIGTTKPIPIDIRVVSATHEDLEALVAEKRFREDLYFRLNAFPINVPALRERPGDIPVLAQHFLDLFAAADPAGGRKVLAPDARLALQELAWPGNVRELKSRIERLAITVPGDVIRAHDLRGTGQRRDSAPLPIPVSNAHSAPGTARPATEDSKLALGDFETATREFERLYLTELLESCNWNITHAADRARLSRTYIHRLIRKHGLERPS